MSVPTNLERLRDHIRILRVKNAGFQKFVPEGELAANITREEIKSVVEGFVRTAEQVAEVVDYIFTNGLKVFSILALSYHADRIERFIHRDQFQLRRLDDLLPFSKNSLSNILKDDNTEAEFFKTQWEFTAPVISGKITIRTLNRRTIFPYLHDTVFAAGAFGSAHKIQIHPGHRPEGHEGQIEFVRKELKLEDQTFENEIHVLSTLQRLNHPNILRLLACYTHGSKGNLIFPFIPGGTLRTFINKEKSPSLTYEELFYLMSGLVSSVWALHEFTTEDTELSLRKGHHQDLRPDNVLFDGDRFILADFGLSSIKLVGDASATPFKGRAGYCQAPECADLQKPFAEHETTRATDVFQLGCLLADLIVYGVRGPSGVAAFRDHRKFELPPMCYYLYHKESASNDAVTQYLREVAEESGRTSVKSLVNLVTRMLEIDPMSRPAAREVAITMYELTVEAFAEIFSGSFNRLRQFPDAIMEEARFQAWKGSLNSSFFSGLPGATHTAKIFGTIINIIRQMKQDLEAIDSTATKLDCRSFFEVRQRNTELLHVLPVDGRSNAQNRLKTILLANMKSGIDDPVHGTLKSLFAHSQLAELADTKQRVAQMDNEVQALMTAPYRVITRPLLQSRRFGPYHIGKVQYGETSSFRSVLMESIQYQDPLRRERLLPRIYKLCKLISSLHLQLRVPRFFGLHDNANCFSFGLLYDLGHASKSSNPRSLREILAVRELDKLPSLDLRLKLALTLSESLAIFHDIEWFHKDLTSFSVIFFPRSDPISTWICKPYLIGFQHSRKEDEDFTEGPLQDKAHHRYHNPEYIDTDHCHFKKFRREYDYYSFGILLLEIACWSTIDTVMEKHLDADNRTFSRTVISDQIPALDFTMGTKYAAAVRYCLVGGDDSSAGCEVGAASKAQENLSFTQKVITPLKSLTDVFLPVQNTSQKRKQDSSGTINIHVPMKKHRSG